MNAEPKPFETINARPINRLLAAARTKRARRIAMFAAAGVFLIWVVSALVDRAAYVSTSDARVTADMIAASTDISGLITHVGVSEGDRVSVGDVLYTIDSRQAEYTLAELEAEANELRAEIAREEARTLLSSSKAGSEVAARRAGTVSAAARVEAARSDYETAQREYERTKGLFERGLVPQNFLDQAKNGVDTAQQALLRADADRSSAVADQRTASIAGEEVGLIEHDLAILRAALDKAEARVAAQEVLVEQHTVRSPINGVVDELFYDEGEHSLRGFRMALLHDPSGMRISANIKETDIRNVQPGAAVEVRADSHPGRMLSGQVTRVHDATMAEAAMMPNPNANGVFTKITQRITVRIDLEPSDIKLRPGTMVNVRIRKQTGEDHAEAAAP